MTSRVRYLASEFWEGTLIVVGAVAIVVLYLAVYAACALGSLWVCVKVANWLGWI